MPRFSVVTPVYNPPADILRACLRSVAEQTLTDWEHLLVDDASTQPHVRQILDAAAAADPRVKVLYRSENGGIVAASNDGLDLATGELVGLLDHDDEIVPEALAAMHEAFASDETIDVAYSDEDHLDPEGMRIHPFYKPDFSPERLRAQNYICHFLVTKRALITEVGGFRPGFDGSQDYDLVLRLTEKARRVHHVPRILYHWRQLAGSVAADMLAKPYAYEAGRKAVQEHCDRVGIDAVVEERDLPGTYRVRRRVQGEPLVSVIIPTRGTSGRVWGAERIFAVEAVRGLVERSTYQHLEFVVVVDTATPPEAIRALERVGGDRLKLVWYDRPFNFAEKMNVGALNSAGEYLLLLNDDVELIADDSVEVLLALAQAPDVAMAGAKLLFADGTLQHAGHVYNVAAYHTFFRWWGGELGPRALLVVERECSGVTAAAAVVKASVFDEVGGFCTAFPGNFNDVDFSLKIREKGYRIVWSPNASWYHFESQSRDPKVEVWEHEQINARWLHRLVADPYYNPNLAPGRDDWVELPFRSGA